MDWANTQYVRVYIGDSRDWLAFGWEGRALFVELLRVTDRAGLLDYEGEADMGILADQVRMPIEVVESALPRLLARKSVIHRDGRLIIPNKLAAQETAQSGAQRTRESRARGREVRRAEALFGNETLPHGVTKRVETVTPGNVETRRVTSGNPELIQSRAMQSRADTPLPPEGEAATADKCPDCDHGRESHPAERSSECVECSCGHGAARNTWQRRTASHAGAQLGAAVTRWLNGRLNRSGARAFNPASKVAGKAGRRWRADGWDRETIQRAVDLRITQLDIMGKQAYMTPGTLFNTKLDISVERHRAGVTPQQLRDESRTGKQSGPTVGWSRPASHEEHEQAKREDKPF